MTDDELAGAVDRSFVGALAIVAESIGGEAPHRRFGAVTAVATGLPSPDFNPIFAFDGASRADLRAAAAWLDGLGVPHQAELHQGGDPGLVEEARWLGLVEDDWLLPGMALAPIPAAPTLPAGLRISAVRPGEPDDLRDYLRAVGTEAREPDLLGRLFSRRLLADPRVETFVGHLDGRPVATSMVIWVDQIAGVYAVHSAEAIRGRGIGTAMTWRAIEAARARGSKVVVLQSSRPGLRVYRAMGFREVVAYRTFSSR